LATILAALSVWFILSAVLAVLWSTMAARMPGNSTDDDDNITTEKERSQ